MLLGTIYVGFYSNYSMIINYIATFINLMITGLIASLGNLNADNDSEHSYSVFRVEKEIKVVFNSKEQADGFRGMCFSWE